MTLGFVLSRLAEELARSNGPVDMKRFTESFRPHDGEAVSLIDSAFEANLLRGRVTIDSFFRATGHISRVTTPVWH